MTKPNSTLPEVSYDEAVAASKEYFGGDELAATVWVSKYALKDSYGHIYERTPEDMHHRIAAEIERIENNYPNPMSRDEVFALLDHFRYIIPQKRQKPFLRLKGMRSRVSRQTPAVRD